jgi:glycosyltransferase involved in cell wall biosynthesis
VAKKKKIPMVFEVRDLWPSVPIALNIIKNPLLRYLANFLERFAYQNSNSIVTLSPTMKKGIVSKGVYSSCIAVIPNSSDMLEFKYNDIEEKKFRQERPWIEKRPLLVYAGTFGKVNNLSYAIRLAKALLERNSKILILLIGDGSEREYLIDEAKKKEYMKLIYFLKIKWQKKKF